MKHFSKLSLVLLLMLVIIAVFTAGCATEEPVTPAPAPSPTQGEEPEAAEEVAYPTKPVEIVVGFNPGATCDILARGLATRLTDLWNVPVMVVNAPGANQATAYHDVAKADPDGHTLFIGVMQTFGQHEYYKTIDVPLQDFEWLGILVNEPLSIIVDADSKFQTFEDLLALDKIRYGDQGYESAAQPFIVTLMDAFNKDFIFTPGYGGADIAMSVKTGEQDFFSRGPAFNHRTGMADEYRVLLVSSDQRHPAEPDAPSLTEIAKKHNLPNLKPNPLYDLAFPIATTPGTPREIVDKIAETIKYLYTEDEQFLKWAEEQGVIHDMHPELIGHDVTEALVAQYIRGYQEIGLEELTERLQ